MDTPGAPHLYLASQSPRRQELLRQIGARFELLLASEEEDAEALEAALPGETPDDYVERVCALKAQAAVRRLAVRRNAARDLPALPILTSDTTVCLGGEILGKPADAADAHRMLRAMSGREHRVLTAVTVVKADGTPMHALSISDVRFAVLTDNDIARYIASGEPFGKAGAYGIQGRAAAFVAHISGSYSGIMGLPLFETAALLSDAGITL